MQTSFADLCDAIGDQGMVGVNIHITFRLQNTMNWRIEMMLGSGNPILGSD